MRTKSFPIEIRALDPDDGGQGGHRLRAYASIFGNVDSYGDIVVPGAFAKTIQDMIPKKRVKLLVNHDLWDPSSLLGTVLFAEEDERGLLIEAEVSSAPSSQDVLTKIIEGHYTEMSFGFDVVRSSPRGLHVQGSLLQELRLWEVSVVTWGANDQTEILAVKSFRDRLERLEREFSAIGAGIRATPTPFSPPKPESNEPISSLVDNVAEPLDVYDALRLDISIQRLLGMFK